MTIFLRLLAVSFLALSMLWGAADLSRAAELPEKGFSSPEWNREETRFSANGTFFSTNTDLFLGQKKRRRGSGGRAWGNFYYGATSLEPKDFDCKIKPDLFGVQFGFDVVNSHGVYSTFYGNYNQSDTDIGSSTKSKIENYLFGFGKYVYLSGCHFGFTAGIGYDSYKVDERVLEASYGGDGLQMNLFGELGIDLVFGSWAFKPFYALQYDFLYHGRIGKADTFQGDRNEHGLIQLMGLRLNWKPLDNLEFQTRTTWVHEMLDNPPPFYNARFSPVQGTSTPAVYFYQGDTGRDWAWIGAGAKWEFVYNIFVYLDYDLTINERHTTHFGTLGICLGW